MKHVVVIGGGFAGLMALKQLIKSKKLKLTLVSKNEYFLFTPRLTELLNDNISKKIAIKGIKDIFNNKINFINGKAEYIDFEKNYVRANERKISYDYLIMAQGATTNFFGIKNAEKYAIDFKNYSSVLKIKSKIRHNVEKFSKSNKKELLTFAVIGGGLTGIELICSLKETVLREIRKYPGINPKKVRLILIQKEKTIAPQFGKNLRLRIENYLRKNNIETMANVRVEDIKNNYLVAKDKTVKAPAIIWTAGIKANAIKTNPQLELDKGNKIKVTGKLKIPVHDNVYVAGDASLFFENNTSLAATAQAAWQEGKHIGMNILRRINRGKEKDFNYTHKGTLIVLGSNHAIFTYGVLLLVENLRGILGIFSINTDFGR